MTFILEKVIVGDSFIRKGHQGIVDNFSIEKCHR